MRRGEPPGLCIYADYSPDTGAGEAVALTQLPSALAFSAECSSGQCRALVATQDRKAELWGITWSGSAAQKAAGSPERAAKARQLLSLRSVSASAATPLLLGEVGYYADQDESGSKWLLTRIGIEWGENQ